MTIIYSNENIGVDGVYANPLMYSEVNKSATKVITDDENIKKDYESVGVKVEALPKKKRERK